MSNVIFNYFLLTSEYRDRNGKFELTFWAAGQDNRARIIVDNFMPNFFCDRTIPASETSLAVERKSLPLKTLDYQDVDCLYFNTYSAMQQCARNLRARYRIYESDVNPVDRYLMERMVCGSMSVEGVAGEFRQFANFHNPRIRGATFKPELRIMSVYVAGGNNNLPITEIACADDVHTHFFNDSDERKIITDFFAYVRLWDPDIIIGHAIIKHTLRVICERASALGITVNIGRDVGCKVASSERFERRRDGSTGAKIVWTARIPGRVVMNIEDCGGASALDNAKMALYKFKQEEILPNAIEKTMRSGQLLATRSSGSIASFDHLYLPRLHRAGFVAANVSDVARNHAPLQGGYVLDPAPGLYENVIVLDFKSLYPSIMMTFKIDPLGFKIRDSEKIANPAGTEFAREISILPNIILELMHARAKANQEKNQYLSYAIKILMNSFYGVLGTPNCRFFSEDLSRTITTTGRYILTTTIKFLEESCNKKVIYGDTDSIFVHLGQGAEDNAKNIGAQICVDVNTYLKNLFERDYGATSKIELQFEKHFAKFFIPQKRHGGDSTLGAKKHYCGAEISADGEMKLTFKGMESARSDWTDLAKEFQRELYTRFFKDESLDDYITEVAKNLSSGMYDNKLIYAKHMNKSIDEYVVNIPPHVQAARLLNKPPRIIKYYITQDGPQPAEKLTAKLDYTHYIDTQLAPIANSILEWSGKNFEAVMSGQQNLFE